MINQHRAKDKHRAPSTSFPYIFNLATVGSFSQSFGVLHLNTHIDTKNNQLNLETTYRLNGSHTIVETKNALI
jgi:hypothetical protein